jgi:hypothetical protein
MTSTTPSEERDGLVAKFAARAETWSLGTNKARLSVPLGEVRAVLAEITRLRAEVAQVWHPVTELPEEGRKVVAIYSDGSGAPLLWKHDYGFLDQEGDEVSHDWFYGNVSVWSYLPDSVEFWCENLAEDPITLTLPGRAALQQEGA